MTAVDEPRHGGRLPDPGMGAICARCDEPREAHGGRRHLGACPGESGIDAKRFSIRIEDRVVAAELVVDLGDRLPMPVLVTAVDELLTFLRAALDAEERAAQGLDETELNLAEHYFGPDVRALLERVPAEVAAKRAILDDLIATEHFLNDREWYGCRAVTEAISADPDEPDVPTGQPCTCGRDADVLRRIRLLAQPCAGRDGWREEWRT